MTNRPEKFEVISKEKYDPNDDLPKINCKNSEKTKYDEHVLETLGRYKEAKETIDEDVNDGFSPARNKRKNRSPNSAENKSKNRKFSPGKAGKAIFNQIRNRGLDINDDSETSDSESEDDANGTVIVQEEGSVAGEPNKPGKVETNNVKISPDTSIAASQ